jgi:hypothetical protein
MRPDDIAVVAGGGLKKLPRYSKKAAEYWYNPIRRRLPMTNGRHRLSHAIQQRKFFETTGN